MFEDFLCLWIRVSLTQKSETCFTSSPCGWGAACYPGSVRHTCETLNCLTFRPWSQHPRPVFRGSNSRDIRHSVGAQQWLQQYLPWVVPQYDLGTAPQGLLALKSGFLILRGILPATEYPFKYHICLNDQDKNLFIFNKNLEWCRHVELEKLIRHVKGDLKLAIGNTSPVFSREIRATVVCVRDAGIERVFNVTNREQCESDHL